MLRLLGRDVDPALRFIGSEFHEVDLTAIGYAKEETGSALTLDLRHPLRFMFLSRFDVAPPFHPSSVHLSTQLVPSQGFICDIIPP